MLDPTHGPDFSTHNVTGNNIMMNFPLQSAQRMPILVVVIISCGKVTISLLCKAAIYSLFSQTQLPVTQLL